ncbi:MAG: hypothetical protein HND59_02920 [Pseudomonadota bacterium]|nr:MAG: hypothetical protein HND59_02920 [Pseudomonadota bacterium]
MRKAFAAALTLLMLWSTGVLAAWCGDPDTHWTHPGADQVWIKSSIAEIHKHREYCSSAPVLSLSALPTANNGGRDGWTSDSSHPSAQGAAAEFFTRDHVVDAVKLARGETGSPPIYLIYQKLLIPFPS